MHPHIEPCQAEYLQQEDIDKRINQSRIACETCAGIAVIALLCGFVGWWL